MAIPKLTASYGVLAELEELRTAYYYDREEREHRGRQIFEVGFRAALERASEYCCRQGLHWLGDDILKIQAEWK